MDKPSIKCPSCGGATFHVTKNEIKSLADFTGASCSNCGRKITDQDVKRQTTELAQTIMRGALNR
jgi:hypothetical protein